MASVECFNCTILGQGGHGAMPHQTIDSIVVAAQEDMSFFLQEVPGCYFFLGAANPQKNLAYPHHHPRFDFDETALAMGVEIFVRCVEKFLSNE